MFGCSERPLAVTNPTVHGPIATNQPEILRLQNHPPKLINRSATSIFVVVLMGMSLSGCMSSPERKQVRLQADDETCASFGARYGSPEYSECMLTQQRRRDLKQLESLERTRITSEIAREGQIMADRARKQRCDRDPSRRECR